MDNDATAVAITFDLENDSRPTSTDTTQVPSMTLDTHEPLKDNGREVLFVVIRSKTRPGRVRGAPLVPRTCTTARTVLPSTHSRLFSNSATKTTGLSSTVEYDTVLLSEPIDAFRMPGEPGFSVMKYPKPCVDMFAY